MKKWLQVIATFALAICAMVLVNVQDVKADLITSTDGQWEYEADYFNNTCTVRTYKGNAVDLVIPSKIDGLTVTKINTEDRIPENIVSVSIPSKVSEIGKGSFAGLKNLRTVNLPSKLEIIGERAFGGCVSLEDVIIPKSVSSIGARAFGYSGIKKVVVEGNPWLGWDSFGGCFENCTNLEYVSMPMYKGSNNKRLFAGCTSLKEVNMPKVQVISEKSFYNCTSLEKIKLPSCLKEIGTAAFCNTSLKTVNLPSTLEYIGNYAFAGTKLSSLEIPHSIRHDSITVGDLNNVDIYVLDPEVALYEVSQSCTIFGFKDSEAYSSAKNNGVRFVQLKGIFPVKGSKKGNASVLSWKKVSGVKLYTIFRLNYEKNIYQKIATTKKNKYIDKSKSACEYYKITYTFKQNGKTLTGGINIEI